MFEQAAKLKLRYETKRGNISTEDLWDLPLTSTAGVSLDDLAKLLNKAVKDNEEESFVVKKSATNTILDLKFSIVKHVIEERLAEIERKADEAATKARKDKILGIIADKEDDELKGESIAKLKAMANKL